MIKRNVGLPGAGSAHLRDVYGACGHHFALWVRGVYGAEPVTPGTINRDLLGGRFHSNRELSRSREFRCFTSAGGESGSREPRRGCDPDPAAHVWLAGGGGGGGLSETIYSFVQIIRFPSATIPLVALCTPSNAAGLPHPLRAGTPKGQLCLGSLSRFPGSVDTQAGTANSCPLFITGSTRVSRHIQLKGLSSFSHSMAPVTLCWVKCR